MQFPLYLEFVRKEPTAENQPCDWRDIFGRSNPIHFLIWIIITQKRESFWEIPLFGIILIYYILKRDFKQKRRRRSWRVHWWRTWLIYLQKLPFKKQKNLTILTRLGYRAAWNTTRL